jgi:hypothetical protein
VYLDLGDTHWRTIEVDAQSWALSRNQRSASDGRRDCFIASTAGAGERGALSEWRRFVNIGSDQDFHLCIAWLISTFGNGPYPILTFTGEQGSAKSTTSRAARLLIDPIASDVRSTPREIRDLAIAAESSHVIAFDNPDGLPVRDTTPPSSRHRVAVVRPTAYRRRPVAIDLGLNPWTNVHPRPSW